MKFKRGQLAMVIRTDYKGAACIVLERAVPDFAFSPGAWYKVYMIERQRTTYFKEYILSPINPQEAENEV